MSIRYLDIVRMCVNNGPGLRTTIHFKGCSLACKWCHRPESISRRRQAMWYASQCLGCHSCLSACKSGAVALDGDGALRIDQRRCESCFSCAAVCPSRAMQVSGTDAAPESLSEELVKDQPYFGAEGGVTLSGGEPLAQEDAVTLLQLLKKRGVHTAVETCGMVFPAQLERALDHTDLLIFDLKLMDDGLHRRFTGQSNAIILRNLGAAAMWAKGKGRLWMRTPIVPGVTDGPENIRLIGERIAALGSVERWELYAFDNSLTQRYARLGSVWPYGDTPLLSKTRMDALLLAAQAAKPCPSVVYTGPLRDE